MRKAGSARKALRHVDEVTYRIWRLFMSGSACGFESGRLNAYQTLLVEAMTRQGVGMTGYIKAEKPSDAARTGERAMNKEWPGAES